MKPWGPASHGGPAIQRPAAVRSGGRGPLQKGDRMIGGWWPRFETLVARRRRQLLPIVFCLSVAGTGCASGVGTPDATAGGAVAPPATNPSVSGSAGASGVSAPQLLVLADGVQGGLGLWTYSGGNWTARWPLPGATVLGRDGQSLILGIGASLELRAETSPQTPGVSVSPQWGNRPLSGAIVGVDRSDAGLTAIVVSQASGLAFGVVAADGSTSDLVPAPDSPFGPSVAWLDSERLAVISSDARQIPHVAVVDAEKHKIVLLSGLVGVRVFALSPDRRTLAAATESAVYVAPVGDWLADQEPSRALSLDPSQVVWDLALSGDGSSLALLSGTEDASGVVTGIHEITYGRRGSGWSKQSDSAAPFSRAVGQVWVG